MQKIQQTEKKTARPPRPKCYSCKSICKKDEMYKSRSKRYSLEGTYIWCSNCIKNMYLEFTELYREERPLALLSVCKILDIPYIREIADSLDMTDSTFVGKYINRVGMDSRHNGKCFSEGDIIRECQISIAATPALNDETEDFSISFEITEEMRRLWKNPSYESEDFAILWEHYQQLQELHYDANDQQRNYFPVLADLFLKREKAGWREGGLDEYDKLSKLYNATYSAAGFTPKENVPVNKGDITMSNIVQLCESKGFIEPWEYRKKYPQRHDEVWRQELDNLNHINKNEGLPVLKELPRYCIKAATDDIYTKDEIEKADSLSMDDIEQEIENMNCGGDDDANNE